MRYVRDVIFGTFTVPANDTHRGANENNPSQNVNSIHDIEIKDCSIGLEVCALWVPIGRACVGAIQPIVKSAGPETVRQVNLHS